MRGISSGPCIHRAPRLWGGLNDFFFPQAKIDLWSLVAQLREGEVYFFRRFLIRYKPFPSISSLWLFSNAIFWGFFCNWWQQSDFMNITYVCKSCACLNLFLLYFPSFPFFALLFLSGRQWEPGFYLFCVLDPMSVFFTKPDPSVDMASMISWLKLQWTSVAVGENILLQKGSTCPPVISALFFLNAFSIFPLFCIL